MVSETPTDGRCNYESEEGYCEAYPMDNGRCYHHGGKSQDGGAPEENDNAVTHGAFSKHFTSNLTESEQEAFDDVVGQLDSPAGAQDVARKAAAVCLLQFHRSGDERFLRRFEGICDKFGIAPADELEVTGDGLDVTLSTDEKDALNDMMERSPQS